MSEYQEFTGKSVEEAIKGACDQFGVGLADLGHGVVDRRVDHVQADAVVECQLRRRAPGVLRVIEVTPLPLPRVRVRAHVAPEGRHVAEQEGGRAVVLFYRFGDKADRFGRGTRSHFLRFNDISTIGQMIIVRFGRPPRQHGHFIRSFLNSFPMILSQNIRSHVLEIIQTFSILLRKRDAILFSFSHRQLVIAQPGVMPFDEFIICIVLF